MRPFLTSSSWIARMILVSSFVRFSSDSVFLMKYLYFLLASQFRVLMTETLMLYRRAISSWVIDFDAASLTIYRRSATLSWCMVLRFRCWRHGFFSICIHRSSAVNFARDGWFKKSATSGMTSTYSSGRSSSNSLAFSMIYLLIVLAILA